MSPRASLLVLAAAAIAAACGGESRRAGGAAGLATVFDSTADSVIARVDGEVPISALRTLVAEMRIAPGMDDTSLFADVSSMVVDQAGRMWVYEFQGRRFFLFDSTGRLVRQIGRRGQGPGEFASGNGMVVLADTGLAVLDAQNARVSFFDASGAFRTSWPIPAGFSTSNGLLSDRSHTLYLKRPVADVREGEVIGQLGLVRLLEGGSLRDSLVPPELPVPRVSYLAVSPDGNGRSQTSTEFAPAYHWAWHPEGFFVVAHGGLYEIVLARPQGKPVVIRRSSTPVAVLPDEQAEDQARITWSMRNTQPGWTWNGPEIPSTKPPLGGLVIARDGTIWARVAAPSERIPADELPPQREGGFPIRHFRTPAIYEVFAPDGRFLGRVPMPPRTTLVQADGSTVWGITRDTDDLPAVVRFRMEPPFDIP